MSRVGYNLKQAVSQMGRNKAMYFTSVLAITAMMLILGLFFVAFVNVNMFAKSIEKDVNVVQIYIKDGSSEEVTKAVGTALEKTDGVDRTEFVTKADAMEALKKKWGDNGYLLENLPENPLPDSYVVYVSDKDAANSVAASAPKIEGVEDVVYYRDTIEKLAQISHFIEVGSLVAMGFLVIVSIIIVANTIKLTVFNREKEIGIMKYLGATNWFVKAPFIWGGIIIGVLSALCFDCGFLYFHFNDLIMDLINAVIVILTVVALSSGVIQIVVSLIGGILIALILGPVI